MFSSLVEIRRERSRFSSGEGTIRADTQEERPRPGFSCRLGRNYTSHPRPPPKSVFSPCFRPFRGRRTAFYFHRGDPRIPSPCPVSPNTTRPHAIHTVLIIVSNRIVFNTSFLFFRFFFLYNCTHVS